MIAGCKFWVSTEKRCGQAVDWTVGSSIDLCEAHARMFLQGLEHAAGDSASSVAKSLRFRSRKPS